MVWDAKAKCKHTSNSVSRRLKRGAYGKEGDEKHFPAGRGVEATNRNRESGTENDSEVSDTHLGHFGILSNSA